MTSKVARILERRRPKCMTDQVRRHWTDIQDLRAGGLLYKQIRDVLAEEYNIDMTYRQFLSVCWQVRMSQAKEQSTIVESIKTKDISSDPIEMARQKLYKDNRGSTIIAGKE